MVENSTRDYLWGELTEPFVYSLVGKAVLFGSVFTIRTSFLSVAERAPAIFRGQGPAGLAVLPRDSVYPISSSMVHIFVIATSIVVVIFARVLYKRSESRIWTALARTFVYSLTLLVGVRLGVGIGVIGRSRYVLPGPKVGPVTHIVLIGMVVWIATNPLVPKKCMSLALTERSETTIG